MAIDASARVDPGATIGRDVEIGPYCVVGKDVTIGDGTRLTSHVVIEGPTEIGKDNAIAPMASLGGPPQDLKYAGEPTRLVVGDGNSIREYVTMNRGTVGGGGLTRVGSGNLFMVHAHVGHDARVGDRTVFANSATLAGHVEVADGATVGAFSAVHQFCRVGREAFIGGFTVVTRDALPWVTTVGNRAKAFGLNLVGLKRKGYDKAQIEALKDCYRTLFRSGKLLADAIAELEERYADQPEARYFVEFVKGSERGVCR